MKVPWSDAIDAEANAEVVGAGADADALPTEPTWPARATLAAPGGAAAAEGRFPMTKPTTVASPATSAGAIRASTVCSG